MPIFPRLITRVVHHNFSSYLGCLLAQPTPTTEENRTGSSVLNCVHTNISVPLLEKTYENDRETDKHLFDRLPDRLAARVEDSFTQIVFAPEKLQQGFLSNFICGFLLFIKSSYLLSVLIFHEFLLFSLGSCFCFPGFLVNKDFFIYSSKINSNARMVIEMIGLELRMRETRRVDLAGDR